MKYRWPSNQFLGSNVMQKLLKMILVMLLLSLAGSNSGFAQPVAPSDQEESNRINQQEELRHRTQQEAENRRKVEHSNDTFLLTRLGVERILN